MDDLLEEGPEHKEFLLSMREHLTGKSILSAEREPAVRLSYIELVTQEEFPVELLRRHLKTQATR